MLKYFVFLMIFCFSLPFTAFGSQIEMADFLRESGKIYVVVVCIVIIFLGFLTYLIFIDKKVSKLEKKLDEKEEKLMS